MPTPAYLVFGSDKEQRRGKKKREEKMFCDNKPRQDFI